MTCETTPGLGPIRNCTRGGGLASKSSIEASKCASERSRSRLISVMPASWWASASRAGSCRSAATSRSSSLIALLRGKSARSRCSVPSARRTGKPRDVAPVSPARDNAASMRLSTSAV